MGDQDSKKNWISVIITANVAEIKGIILRIGIFKICMYIWQQEEWPRFHWDNRAVLSSLARVRYEQGLLLGKLQAMW